MRGETTDDKLLSFLLRLNEYDIWHVCSLLPLEEVDDLICKRQLHIAIFLWEQLNRKMSAFQDRFLREIEIQQAFIKVTKDLRVLKYFRQEFCVSLAGYHQLVVSEKDAKHRFIEYFFGTHLSLC